MRRAERQSPRSDREVRRVPRPAKPLPRCGYPDPSRRSASPAICLPPAKCGRNRRLRSDLSLRTSPLVLGRYGRRRPQGRLRSTCDGKSTGARSCAGGQLDGGAYAGVGRATADVSGHCRIDFSIIGRGIALDESRRAHDLTRLAVAALDDLEFEPRLLDPAPALLLRDGLDRRHFARAHVRRRQHAGPNGTAVDVYGAGAALRYSASELGALEVQEIAQNPEQWHVVGSLYRIGAPVDVERYHLSFQSMRMEHCPVGKTFSCPISTRIGRSRRIRFTVQPAHPSRKSRSSLLTASGCSSCGRWPQCSIEATERFSAISLQ